MNLTLLSDQLRFILFMFKSIRLIPKYFKQNRLSVKNIKRYIQGNYRLYTFEQQPQFLKEQIWFRLSKANSECLKNTFCPCTCPVVGRASAEDSCERNCYPIMMDEETWQVYKEINQVNNFTIGQNYMKDNLNLI